MESGLFKDLTERALNKSIKATRNANGVEPRALAAALLSKFGSLIEVGDDEVRPLKSFRWVQFGAVACEVFRPALCAKVDFMLGAVEPPKVRRQAAQRAKKQPVAREQRPEEMDTRKQTDANETSKLTEQMYGTLSEHSGRPYSHFVLDRQSFAQTVENMFSVAMLVGSGKCALRVDDEWGMKIELLRQDKKGAQGGKQDAEEAQQMVLNMNYRVWEQMREAVAPGDCLTPHRASIKHQFSGQVADAENEPNAPRSKKHRVSRE